MRAILVFSLLIFSFSSAFAGSYDYLSVAFCTSEVEQGIESLEIFHGDNEKGLAVSEVYLEHGVARLAHKVKVKATAVALNVTFGKETFNIGRSTDGKPFTFTIEGQQFTCSRTNW